jgi:hypothetical protein
MKKLVLALCATAFLGACSHTNKKAATTPAPAATPTTMEKVKGKTSKAAAKVKAEAKEMKADAKEAVASATSATKIECKNGADVRTVEIKTTGTSCEVVYTKGGQAETKATGLASSGHCGQVLEKMKTNLTGSGFTCN